MLYNIDGPFLPLFWWGTSIRQVAVTAENDKHQAQGGNGFWFTRVVCKSWQQRPIIVPITGKYGPKPGPTLCREREREKKRHFTNPTAGVLLNPGSYAPPPLGRSLAPLPGPNLGDLLPLFWLALGTSISKQKSTCAYWLLSHVPTEASNSLVIWFEAHISIKANASALSWGGGMSWSQKTLAHGQ